MGDGFVGFKFNFGEQDEASNANAEERGAGVCRVPGEAQEIASEGKVWCSRKCVLCLGAGSDRLELFGKQ